MPEIVMKLCGKADGQPTPGDGEFLKAFDFEAHDGVGEITLTKDIAEAKRFSTMVDAWTFWKTVPECKPIREDGKPNRPLTSTNWEFFDAAAQGGDQ